MITIGSTVFVTEANAITNTGIHYATYPVRVTHVYYPKHRGPVINGQYEIGKDCFEREEDCRKECNLMNSQN